MNQVVSNNALLESVNANLRDLLNQRLKTVAQLAEKGGKK